MLPCDVEKKVNQVPCGMSQHNMGAMWCVIYTCHMAWPKHCLIAIWHVLDLAYVPCSMVRLSLGNEQHGIGLAQASHGLDKSSLGATWHGVGLAQGVMWHGLGLAYVPCGMPYPSLTQVSHGVPSLAQVSCVMFQLSLGATWHGIGQARCHVASHGCHVACHRFYVAWLRPNLCAMSHGLDLTYVPCRMAQAQHMCHVACLMSCLDAMWDGLDLAYVSHGMAQAQHMCYVLCLGYMPFGMA